MCYQVILSTDTPQDLALKNCELLGFDLTLPFDNGIEGPGYPHIWHVQSKSLCSCTFRHAYDLSLGFGEPVDWYPEEDDALQATTRFTAVVRELVASGYRVDCLDLWQGEFRLQSEPTGLIVDLSTVRDSEFRFFENCLMQFSAG